MAEGGNQGEHKRSGSSFAKSILHRDRTKGESQDGDTLSVASSTEKRSRSPLRRVLSKRQPQDEANTLRGEPSAVPSASTTAISSSMASPPPKQDESKSIEQSVKMFKIFDILRHGDNAAITQAVKDCAEGRSQLQGTTILHLAVQCAQPAVIEQVIFVSSESKTLDLNAQDKDGNTPLHLAAQLGRPTLVQILLAQHTADSSVLNYQGRSALDLSKTPEIFQQLQLDRAVFAEEQVKNIHQIVAKRDYEGLEKVLADSRVMAALDVNGAELASEPATVESGGSLLHEGARKKDIKLIQILLLNGADPFRRDRRGKLPQDITKDDKTKAILKKSPAATAAQRGIQEKAILGGTGPDSKPGGKESREIKGYLKKWTNYTSGYKLRWFVLEDGVLSYYKHQDDAGSACRGAMNMRIAKLSMDAQDKTRFEIHGKSSVKYHLKANHAVEAKRWFWALNNAIQWAKDELKEEQRAAKEAEAARLGLTAERSRESTSFDIGSRSLAPSVALYSGPQSTTSFQHPRPAASAQGDEGSVADSHDPSVSEYARVTSRGANVQIMPGEPDEDDEYGEDASSHEIQPAPKDAFNITAHSANLQLDLLSQVSKALQAKAHAEPTTTLDDASVVEALTTYEGAVNSLKGMVGDLLKIARDRDAYWQYRLDREVDLRRLWEDSMAKVALEQEELEGRIGESEEKRKRTKKALKEALEESTVLQASEFSQQGTSTKAAAAEKPKDEAASDPMRLSITSSTPMRRSTIAALGDLSESDTDEEEFYDAVGAGEIPVEQMPQTPREEKVPDVQVQSPTGTVAQDPRLKSLEPSFKGYEDPVRTKLKLDADDRPRISLWSVLKSMIGKDMTKMTLPVSFNEPTSLLQRVAEDMEYSDLLDVAAERDNSAERMVYVAAFAASEYASTIGRVAKPFNPLLGETFEYCRPDKGYRFFLEQVSHHPPIGALWAESAKWDYWGESNVKSKFTGKSFDINHLGTWYLKLRSKSGSEELYTWKKASQSVVGIITGSPVVDNYGPMRIKNWNTGEECQLDFKARGWKASSAYQVTGKIVDADGDTKWSLGGRWNDKLYARPTPGFDALVDSPANQAFLIWQAHPRPPGIPFNLTPYVVTLNALPENLQKHLPRTDTRLRPDQRAMEDGEYDFAASEKTRVEEKQRAKRRDRERGGEVWQPRWFSKARDKTTGEEYWATNGDYWKNRESVSAGGEWKGLEDIF